MFICHVVLTEVSVVLFIVHAVLLNRLARLKGKKLTVLANQGFLDCVL